MTNDLRASTIHGPLPETKIRRFTVHGVPGARAGPGATRRQSHRHRALGAGSLHARVLSEGDVRFVDALSAGARAIYERTAGDCP